jgi:hypothetical protein
MKKIQTLLFIMLGVIANVHAQQKDYYYNIPDTPGTYTAATVAARIVDGLGFRYYWATEGLRDIDLSYRPSDSARSSFETLQHIFNLTLIVLNTVSDKPTEVANIQMPSTFAALREQTLQHIKEASEILKRQDTQLENLSMAFKAGDDKESSFPYWNLINGPMSDALFHTGQIVSFRRSSGNPIAEGVDYLTGKKSDVKGD